MKKVITIIGIFGLIFVQAQVGINKDTPQATLDIKSEVNTLKALKITNSANTEIVTVTDDGKMGIGTANPTEKLEVDGHVSIGKYIPKGYDVVTTEDFGYGSRLFFNGKAHNSDPLYIARYNVSSDNTELRVVIGDEGTDKFVVGHTSVPSENYGNDFYPKFTVHGNGNIQARLIRSQTNFGYMTMAAEHLHYAHFETDRNQFYFNKAIRVNSGVIRSYDEDLRLGVIESDAIVVKNPSLNVGIGTSSPTQRLEVVGKIKATGFMVGSTNLSVPDYVFQKYYTGASDLNSAYEFKTLSQVENFVKTKGHLPGYLSAKEVKEQGSLDMTKTQLINIEKIEELYLHTIEQEKRIEAQNKKIEKLEALVEQLIKTK